MPRLPKKNEQPAPPKSSVGTRRSTARIVEKLPYFKSMCVNDIQVQTTPWDVRLILGRIDDVTEDEVPILKVVQLGEMHMSPQMAKQLLMILADQLAGYEGRFGPVLLPGSIQQKI